MELDAQLFVYLNTVLSTPPLSAAFQIVTWLGNGWGQAALILPLMYWRSRQKFKDHFMFMVLTAAVGGLLVVGLKIGFNRPRPPAYFANTDQHIHTPAGEPSDRSFPSGHTQTAFSTATYLSCLYRPLTPALMIGASLVGLSRVAMGVHFPLDVLVGALLGIGMGVVGYRFRRRRIHDARWRDRPRQ